MMHPISGGEQHNQQGRLKLRSQIFRLRVPKSNEKWNHPPLIFDLEQLG
jgi:hypothetical protein